MGSKTMLSLVKPSVKYKRSFVAAEKEFQKEDGRKDSEIKKLENNFASFIKKMRDYERGRNLPKGSVPRSNYWLMDGSEFIGIVTVRYGLNPNLRKKGGHIGYVIRPTKRNMGYGKKILGFALQKAKKLGIKKVLITCSDSNAGSWKIVEAHGGTLENKIRYKGELLRRYWIKI